MGLQVLDHPLPGPVETTLFRFRPLLHSVPSPSVVHRPGTRL